MSNAIEKGSVFILIQKQTVYWDAKHVGEDNSIIQGPQPKSTFPLEQKLCLRHTQELMSWPETACGHVGLQQLRGVGSGEAPEGPQSERRILQWILKCIRAARWVKLKLKLLGNFCLIEEVAKRHNFISLRRFKDLNMMLPKYGEKHTRKRY